MPIDPEDRKARKRLQNRLYARKRRASQTEEATAHLNSPRLTANLSRATVIRLPSGKALPAKEATWLK